jgi:hypothetical protein
MWPPADLIDQTVWESCAHYLELLNNSDQEEIDSELKRVKREMRQLDKGIQDAE